MVETIQMNGLWHVSLAIDDLVKQAKLKEEDFENEFTHFNYKGRAVVISHDYKKHLVVSMKGSEDRDLKTLMDGFSKVVGYKPFCKYNLSPEGKTPALPTYEWDKINPKGRYKALQKQKNIADLVKI